MAQTGLVTYAAQEQGGSSMGNGGVYRYVKTGAPPKTITMLYRLTYSAQKDNTYLLFDTCMH